jgi:hypothetical protein
MLFLNIIIEYIHILKKIRIFHFRIEFFYVYSLLLLLGSDVTRAVLRSRSIFEQLRLRLVKNFGSGFRSDHFPHIFSKKSNIFHGWKNFFMFQNLRQ